MYLIGSLTLLFLCFNANPLVSSKKLIVFSCHLECGTKRSISQGAGFDVYVLWEMATASLDYCSKISELICPTDACTVGCSSDTCSACHSYCGAACRRIG